MSKFKSFASQSSFRDYQLQAPDESAKIEQQTAKTIRGRQRAEDFRRGNADIYLQAQKLVQGLETQNRETNFRLETENRQAFRDQLNEEYKLQVQADEAKLRAQQRNLQNITEFSQTALNLYGEYEKAKTDRQTKANTTRVYKAGADYNTVVAIKGLASNLTKAEFAQQDFIREKLEQGGNLDAYFELYESRNTRGFINNIAVAQNEGRAYAGAADEFLKDYDSQNPEASAEERKLAFTAWTSQYAANIAPDLNADLLNGTTFNIVRQAELSILGDLDSQISKERDKKVVNDATQALNVSWDSGGGVAGVHDYHTLNPSERKRKILAGWVVARLKAGTMSPEEAAAIIENEYDGPNGKEISWSTQFPASEEIGLIREAIRDQRRVNAGNYDLTNKELAIETENRIKIRFDEMVAGGDGMLDSEEKAELEELAKQGPVGFESKALETALTYSTDARTAVELDKLFTKMSDKFELSEEKLLGVKGNWKLIQKWLPAAREQDKIRKGPQYKTDKLAIEQRLGQAPRIKFSPITGEKDYTVGLMVNKYMEMYKQTLAKTKDPGQARSVTLTAIDTLLSVPESITPDGRYAEIVNEEKALAKKGEKSLESFVALSKTLGDVEIRNNPKKLVSVIGADDVNKAYEDMLNGKPPSLLIKQAAGIARTTPLEFMNYLAVGGLDKPPITLDTQIEQIQSNLKPITRRLYNAPYSTNEMRGRANMSNAELLADAPTRFGGPAKPLSSYAPQVSSIVMEADDGQPGMDIFFEDKKFPAVLPGVVKEIGWQGNAQAGYGNFVVIESTDPATGQKVDVLYAHLEMPTHLTEGSAVMPGMIIGKQGGTGSVRSADGTIASIDFLAPAPKGSKSMVPYRYFRELREQIATQFSQ